ncbi:MAG: carboxypeptidase regulatory-like domain-containing protein [Planctomycetota bacterium]
MSNVRAWGLLFSMAALGIAGCGGPPPLKLADPVPAKGTVTVDDKPLAKALVYFVPDGAKVKGPGSSAITDESGNYELVTVISGKSKPGAIPGNYRVWISSLVGPDGKLIVPDGVTPPANLAAREVLPERFSSPMTSELKAVVADKGGTFDFKVSIR